MVRITQDMGGGFGRQRALRHAKSPPADQIPVKMDGGRGCTWNTGHRHASPYKNHPGDRHDLGKNRARTPEQNEFDATDR